MDAFSFEGIHRHNAVVNFTDEDPFDPKAMWLNAEHDPHAAGGRTGGKMLPFACAAGLRADPAKMLRITPLIQERIKTLARRRHHGRLLLRRRTAALRSAPN